jgi:hypothetical protein
MKNNKIALILLVILIAIAAYFFISKSNSTLSGELKDFAIEDTASIDKIFIADAKGDKVTLTRSENHWIVDGDRKARPESMEVLMTTFYRLAVKSPVAKAAHNNIVRDMATNSTKVEIYQGGDKPSKVYYVGGTTQDNLGTYMLLENDGVKSSVPFIMHIPGFSGYLTTRFYANPLQWRDAAIFRYHPDEVKSLEVTYYEKPEESFKIQNSMNQFSLYDGANQPLQNFDTNRVVQYLGLYENVYYEMVVLDELKQEQKDSIVALNPFFKMELKDILGKSNKVVAYHMRNYKNVLDDNGEPYLYDLDRMYGYLNDEVLVYIQFHTFDKITLSKDVFLKLGK